MHATGQRANKEREERLAQDVLRYIVSCHYYFAKVGTQGMHVVSDRERAGVYGRHPRRRAKALSTTPRKQCSNHVWLTTRTDCECVRDVLGDSWLQGIFS